MSTHVGWGDSVFNVARVGSYHTLQIVLAVGKPLQVLEHHDVIVHRNENLMHVFLFWELRGLSPNLHINVSVSDLYIPKICPHISCSSIGSMTVEIETLAAQFLFWKYLFQIFGIDFFLYLVVYCYFQGVKCAYLKSRDISWFCEITQ